MKAKHQRREERAKRRLDSPKPEKHDKRQEPARVTVRRQNAAEAAEHRRQNRADELKQLARMTSAARVGEGAGTAAAPTAATNTSSSTSSSSSSSSHLMEWCSY